MKSPLIISPLDGKLYDRNAYEAKGFGRALRRVAATVAKWDLVATKIFMNEDDWNDIVKFSKED